MLVLPIFFLLAYLVSNLKKYIYDNIKKFTVSNELKKKQMG